MKPRYTVALSICAGLAIGAATVQALHAQAKPPAYVIAEIDVMDPGPCRPQRKRLRTGAVNTSCAEARPQRSMVSRPNRALP